MSQANQSREVAVAIWNAGVDAVRAERLIDATVRLHVRDPALFQAVGGYLYPQRALRIRRSGRSL